VAESGANALPGRAAGKRENANPGTALEGGNVSGSAVGRFPGVNECATEPAAAAEGDARAGASTAADGGARTDAGAFRFPNEKMT
jgi:hypothetical protein